MPNNLRRHNYSTIDLFGASARSGVFVLVRACFRPAAAHAPRRPPRAPSVSPSPPIRRPSTRCSSIPMPLRSSSSWRGWSSSPSSTSTRAGAPGAGAAARRSRPAPTAALSRRRADDSSTGCGPAFAGATACRSRPPTCSSRLRAILDPRNPVRSHEGYDLIDRADAPDDAHRRRAPQRAWAPAVDDVLLVRFRRRSSSCRRTSCARRQPLERGAVQRGADRRRRTLSLRLVAARRRLRYIAKRAYWRGKPPVARSTVRVVPDPSTNLCCCSPASSTGIWSRRRSSRSCAASRGIAFAKVPTAVVAGLAFNTRASAARRRARAPSHRDVDRPRRDLAKITLGYYPVTNVLQPQFSWAFDPIDPRTGLRSGRAPTGCFDAAGWRRGADGAAAQGRRSLAADLHAIPGDRRRACASRRPCKRRCAQRGIDVDVKSVSNAQLFLPRTGVLATGDVRPRLRAVDDGRRSRRLRDAGCGGASNYMRWCDPRVDALERLPLSTTDASANAKRLYARIGRIVARGRSDPLSLRCRLRVRVSQALARLRSQRVPADVERVAWRCDDAP